MAPERREAAWELYEGYVSMSKEVKVYASERLRTALHFRAKWYVDGFSAEFNCFKPKMSSQKRRQGL